MFGLGDIAHLRVEHSGIDVELALICRLPRMVRRDAVVNQNRDADGIRLQDRRRIRQRVLDGEKA
jgi:hypothetical protein